MFKDQFVVLSMAVGFWPLISLYELQSLQQSLYSHTQCHRLHNIYRLYEDCLHGQVVRGVESNPVTSRAWVLIMGVAFVSFAL